MWKKADRQAAVKDALVVGIDVSKETLYWGMMRQGEQVHAGRPVGNDWEGHVELVREVQGWANRLGLDDIVAGWEPTGPYGFRLGMYLKQQTRWKLVQVQPSYVKRYSEISDGWRGKTDRKDPWVIAELISQGKFFGLTPTEGPWAKLRAEAKAWQALQTDLMRYFNRVHGLTHIMYPKLERWLDNGHRVGVREVVKAYPAPDQLAGAPAEEIVGILKRASRGKWGEREAAQIQGMGRKYAQEWETPLGYAEEMKRSLEMIERLEKSQEATRVRMDGILREVPYAEFLRGYPDMGTVTLAVLLGCWGDLRRYRTAAELEHVAGINLYVISSGKKNGQVQITRRGCGLLRKHLYLLALRRIRPSRGGWKPYEEYVGRGGLRMRGVVKMMDQIVREIFAMVRDGKPYQTEGKGGRQIEAEPMAIPG